MTTGFEKFQDCESLTALLYKSCATGDYEQLVDLVPLMSVIIRINGDDLLEVSAQHPRISKFLLEFGVKPNYNFFAKTVDLPSFIDYCKDPAEINACFASLLFHHRNNPENVKLLLSKGTPVTIPWYKWIIRDDEIWRHELSVNLSKYTDIIAHAKQHAPEIAALIRI